MKGGVKGGFAALWKRIEKRQAERIRKAGKHTCVAVECGTVSRVTGRNGVILKRPVTITRLYECELCGRTMDRHTHH